MILSLSPESFKDKLPELAVTKFALFADKLDKSPPPKITIALFEFRVPVKLCLYE